MLSDGAEPDEVVLSLAKECDVQPEAIRGEVLEFINALKGADILE